MSEGLHNATYMGEQVSSQEFQRLRNDTNHLRIARAPPPSLPHTPNLRIRPPEMYEGDAVYIYMQGLDPVIRTAVSLQEHTTVASASAMAARVSSQQQVYTLTSSTPISRRHPTPSGTVMPTGFAPSFPPVVEPMDLSAMDVKEVKCHRCHKLGHYARMCKAATPHPDNKA